MSQYLHQAFQDLRIRKNDVTNDQNKHRSQGNSAHLQALEEKIDSLYLMNLAALELLQDMGVRRSDILRKIEEIDLRDGKLDGKVASSSHCKDCGHKVSPRRRHCFYCGANIAQLQF
ncbi:hypothetical protein CWC31_08235 [Pseudoalteromonas ruthenica]|uniref:hypothetical protein n=1 Tax=Pseudoalteromonas ruthenica TaxID=151081 RepID=UPI000344EFB3|nr:hypothetical protein [Pseudoalteromonas ruthenica]TLX50964.1 hypothetical protein CWC31_08235 [Pseudoalteromonas ruthenica]